MACRVPERAGGEKMQDLKTKYDAAVTANWLIKCIQCNHEGTTANTAPSEKTRATAWIISTSPPNRCSGNWRTSNEAASPGGTRPHNSVGRIPAMKAGRPRFEPWRGCHGGFDAHRNTSEQTMTAGKTARRVVPGGYMAM